ncbi:DUF397 domain-containing protein [Streptomyces sp. MMS24-I2-30]|uniref:DUF397 domain-containing protein n=1 Tax=Streptomyces sp. MMS24-I2-30 TaxID=3351564 RepID=UPI0038968630
MQASGVCRGCPLRAPIEVATNLAIATPHGHVPVRDSKNPDGPALTLPTHAFTSFVAGVKAGEFGAV